ncbi:hypothetical protein SBRCBS47491_003605 [Sporothrix bragantina]|uniref:Filamentation protein n=1 Tax=Sporothrix bragantina TaxID=671064 RepID=A0ABP0BGK6_9PEZI
MSRSVTKAAHYVLQLDETRCEGDWDAVPENVRKIRKHAPSRACLTLTAETECAIEKATRNHPHGHQSDASGPAPGLDAATRLPKLKAVIDEETVFLQDRFQARVCIGWLHWVTGDYDTAIVELPRSLDAELSAPDRPADNLAITDWTRVCALKSAYLRANCLARKGQRKEALTVFGEGLHCITTAYAAQQTRKQLRYWSELFLTEYCMLLSHTLEKGEASLEDPNLLVSLRSWARYWEGTNGASQLGGYGFRGSVPRRRIWYEYYSVLSSILEDDLPYPPAYAPAGATGDSSARNQLRIELKKVEAVYETLLLEETSFPRAEDERVEVEEFVRLVVQNWSVLKGRGWHESDLGQGGRESASRGVLDILYRASTKTYHSTSILRYLFTVHLAVAEFDLAFKAFDSYLSLIKKGKARIVKTGKDEPSLDDDATVLETISVCIVALCRYGDRTAAEKAHGLGHELEQCLREISHAAPERIDEEDAAPEQETTLVSDIRGTNIPLRVLALSWQAVGLSLAQWARMTYDSASRTDIQAKAVRALRKSLSPEFGKSGSLRGVFALGMLLVDQRELGAAIDLVKGALMSTKAQDADQDYVNGPYWRERAMIPLWHLLSLLLSARQDYIMAARACEGAFEQFNDPSVLFGSETMYRSEHLNEAEANDEKHANWSRGLVDDMEDFEKERILEVKMTQLALVELLESPKVAVNASLELLSLFARLFGPPQATKSTLAVAPKTGTVPKSSAGTLRSIKGSIFGRSSGGRPTTKHSSMVGLEKAGGSATAMRPQTMQTVASRDAPAIQVTNDFDDFRRSRKSGNFNERRSQSGKRNSLRKRDSSGSRRRAVSSGGAMPRTSMVDSPSDPVFAPLALDESQASDLIPSPLANRQRVASAASGPPVSMSRQASQVDSITSSSSRAKTGGDAGAGGGGSGDLSAAATSDGAQASLSLMPVIQFSKEHEKRRRSTILVEVWLMIAGFYRRAEMFDDAKRATAEAQKLVQELEIDATRNSSSSSALRSRGWVGKKSVDELWADVWAEMGYLSLDKGVAYNARLDFEAALTHFPDHPAATIGLSNILLDIYSEKLVLPHAIPQLALADGTLYPPKNRPVEHANKLARPALPNEPLGLSTAVAAQDPKERRKQLAAAATSAATAATAAGESTTAAGRPKSDTELPPPYKASSLPPIDRLAARDRAFTLLSSLTKLGTAWNNSEAWFALARAHEESGQADKAKEVLWWCVELEESAAARPWSAITAGGYVL